ncbi:MAG: hypothetical protein ABI707_12880 [Ferruginibacter sp.]
MQLPDKDNEFDDLIKAAGDNYQTSGASPDWEHMQGLLDKHMPVKKGTRKTAFLLLLLSLLLMGGAYLYFSTINFKASKLVKEHQPSVSAVSPAAPDPSGNVNPRIGGKSATGDKLHQPQSLENKETAQAPYKIVATRHNHPKNKAAGSMKINTQPGEIAENNPPVKTTDENKATSKNESINPVNDSTIKISPQKEISHTDEDKKPTEKPASPDLTIAENKIPPDTKHTAGKQKKNNETGKHPPEFSLVYAPELTTVGFSNVDKPGSNYGLLIGYQISKNIIIQTGVIRSKKNYIANGKDFEMSYMLPASSKLNKVDGYCMMYEIPLNIKSQILKGKKLNLYYTAGISSYIMTSQFYTYDISTNTGSYTKDVKYNSQKNYWLSVATAGLGVEKKISNTLNISAAPFIKIPFKGMGEGKLRLTGTGINFSLSYQPSFSKK